MGERKYSALIIVLDVGPIPAIGIEEQFKIYSTMSRDEITDLLAFMYKNKIPINYQTVIATIDYGGRHGWFNHIALTKEEFEESKIAEVQERDVKNARNN